MAILTLTSADAGKTIPVSGSADWVVYGTDAADTIEVAAGSSATVNGGAGTDVVKLLGGSADYTVKLSGSNVVFTHTSTGKTVTVPVTSAGDSVSFGNGTAVTLKSTTTTVGTTTTTTVTLGAQTLSATDAAVTGATGTATGATTGTTAGQSFSLTTAATADTLILTTGNDTVTGASGTVVDADSIIDSSSTDVDTANLVVTAKYTPSKITNVENINVDWNAFGLAHVDAVNVTGTSKITLTSSKLGYLGNAQVDNVGAQTVVAGSGVIGALDVNGGTTVVVDAGAAKTVTVDGAATNTSATVTAGAATTKIEVGLATAFASTTVTGSAATTTIQVDGTAGSSDVATITTAADATVGVLTAVAETVTINAAAGKKVTIADGSLFDKVTVASSGAVTLAAGSDELTTHTLTNSTTGLTIDLTSDAAADLSKVQFTTLNLKNNLANDLTLATGQTVQVDVALNNTGEFIATTGTADTITMNISVDQTYVDVLDGTKDIETLTVNAVLGATDADGVLTFTDIDGKNIILKGSNKVTLTEFAATTLDASALTGEFTATQRANAATTVTGSATAKNTIVLAATATEGNYTGGSGVDIVTMAQTTGNSSVVLGDGSNTYTNNTLTDGTAVVIGGSGIDTITVKVTDSGANTGNVAIHSGGGADVISLDLKSSNKETASVDMGAGDDKITLVTATGATDVLAIEGGDGTDIIDLNNLDLTDGSITVTGVEILRDSAGAAKVDAALIGGKSYTIQGNGNVATLLDVDVDVAGSYDFSTLVLDNTIANGIGGLNITGNAGNDTVVGTAGADTIATSGGNDVITGGNGQDTITLGGGNDTVVIASGHAGTTGTTIDIVAAFKTAGTDVLKLGTAGTATNYVEVDMNTNAASDYADALAAANTALNGTVRFAVIQNSADTGTGWNGTTNALVFIDFNLDGDADAAVQLTGVLGADIAFGDIIA